MNKVCRLCLRSRASKNIFDDSTIHDKLLSYCKLNITRNDGLPEQICNRCTKKLECVVQFIDKCEESDRVLRNNCAFFNAVDCVVKDEPDTDTDDRSFKFEDTSDDDEYIPSFVKGVASVEPKAVVKHEDIKKNILQDNNALNNIDDDKIPLSNFVKRNKVSQKKTKSKKVNSGENISEITSTELVEFSNVEVKTEAIIDFQTYADEPCSENELHIDSQRSNKIKEKSRKIRNSKFTDESQLCFTCGKCFPRASYLRQHILKHSGESHKCGQCPKSFSTRELMKVHERRHVQEKTFPCQVCGHTFSSGYLAKKHHKMVHEKNYAVACQLCNKVLSNRRSLSEHMKIHTGEKNFECKICGKKFAHKLSLVCHTRVHTGEQPYCCRYCEKRFTILKSLKEHERLHTGEKPYGCPLCPKRFEQLGNMKSHFRYNHKGLDLKQVQQAKAKAEELPT